MNVNTLIANPGNYTPGRGGKSVQFLAVHYTDGDGSAKNNCVYFNRESVGSSAHYFIDDEGIWQSVRDEDTAYAVGNFDMNQRSISIEVVSSGEDFSNAEIAHLAELVQSLVRRYDIKPENVIRHYDCYDFAKKYGYGSGKWIDPHKSCPAPYVDNSKWHALWEKITGGADIPYEPPSSNATENFGGTYKVMVNGLNVRTQPNLSAEVVAHYNKGMTVELDDAYTKADGYIWGTYIGRSGNRRYIAVGKATGKVEPDDYLIKV